MAGYRLGLAACILALMALTATAQDNCQATALDRHNLFRRRHGADDLVWDAQIAAGAQAYANTLASQSCTLIHDQRRGQLGENLKQCSRSVMDSNGQWTAVDCATCGDATDDWYSEIQQYPITSDTPYSQMGNSLSAVGHFTQVVWKATKRVGCGKVQGPSGCIVVVCRYDPPGNFNSADDTLLAQVGKYSGDTSIPPAPAGSSNVQPDNNNNNNFGANNPTTTTDNTPNTPNLNNFGNNLNLPGNNNGNNGFFFSSSSNTGNGPTPDFNSFSSSSASDFFNNFNTNFNNNIFGDGSPARRLLSWAHKKASSSKPVHLPRRAAA